MEPWVRNSLWKRPFDGIRLAGRTRVWLARKRTLNVVEPGSSPEAGEPSRECQATRVARRLGPTRVIGHLGHASFGFACLWRVAVLEPGGGRPGLVCLSAEQFQRVLEGVPDAPGEGDAGDGPVERDAGAVHGLAPTARSGAVSRPSSRSGRTSRLHTRPQSSSAAMTYMVTV